MGTAVSRKPINKLAVILGEQWFIVLLGFALFVGLIFPASRNRGPLRRLFSASGMSDFLPMYVQAKAWMKGMDPYSQTSQLALWPKEVFREPLSPEYLVSRAGMPTPYPVLVFVFLIPFAILPWPMANASLILLDFALLFVTIRILMRFSGMDGMRRMAWIAAVLAFEPVYAGMASNNIGVFAVECALLAFAMSDTSPYIVRAFLLAVSVALKPQIGFCFLLYFFLRGRWRLVAPAVGMLAAALAVALLRMQEAHVAWMESYLQASKFFFHAGGINDFRPGNLYRFDLINLQLVLYPWLGSAKGAHLAALSLGGLLFGLWLVLLVKSRGFPDSLAMGALSAINLLPFYHRYYDATLLLLPLCWYLVHFRAGEWRDRMSLLLWAPFLVPVAGPFRLWLATNTSPDRWLDAFVRPITNWCLLALTLFLLWNLYRASMRLEQYHA
jgi:alpha-1,2-mannosyltransferase